MSQLKNQREIKWTFWVAFVCGLLTHGYVLFNKISYHDDIFCLYSLGGTFDSGRWGLGLMGIAMRKLFGGLFSMPAFNGILSVAIIAVASVLIVLMFEVKDLWWAAGIACVMETIPVATSTFSYMFTAPYYMVALCSGTLAAYLMSRHKKLVDWYGIGAIVAIAFAVGIYQAYFAVTVALILSFLIWNKSDKQDALALLKEGIWNVLVLGLGLVSYALLSKFFLAVTDYELSDYRGVNSMFDITPAGIASSVVGAYQAFFRMFVGDYVGLSSLRLINLALIVLWICALGLLVKEFSSNNKRVWEKVLYVAMLLLLPLAYNIVNVMVSGGDTEVHTLMLYSLALMFVFPSVVISRFTGGCAINSEKTKGKLVVSKLAKVFLLVVAFAYLVVDNQAYMRAELLQNQAKAFYNRLIYRIESVSGYEQTNEIYIAGALTIADQNLTEIPDFPAVRMTGYTMSTEEFINDYAWKEFVRWQLGYDPVYGSNVPDTNLIEAMTCYPDDGSIVKEGNVVIVKLGSGQKE